MPERTHGGEHRCSFFVYAMIDNCTWIFKRKCQDEKPRGRTGWPSMFGNNLDVERVHSQEVRQHCFWRRRRWSTCWCSDNFSPEFDLVFAL